MGWRRQVGNILQLYRPYLIFTQHVLERRNIRYKISTHKVELENLEYGFAQTG